MDEIETFFIIAEPVHSQCTLSLPPENIRKPQGFLMFSGVEKGCIGNENVKGYH